MTPIEQLIAEFSLKADVSSIYVTHSIDSGIVTRQKRKYDTQLEEIALHEDFIRVYQDDVGSWIKLLKFGDSQNMLVIFFFCHDKELNRVRIVP